MAAILLTGVNGFIGAHTARAMLTHGDSVIGIARPSTNLTRLRDVVGLEVVRADLTDPETVARALRGRSFDACVHLAWAPAAARSMPNDQVLAVHQSIGLLRLLAEIDCRRLVAAGSCLEYAPSEEVLTESSPVQARDLYTAAKIGFHQVAEQLCHQLGTELAWPRIFYVYGPQEDPRRLIPTVIRSLLQGAPALTSAGEQVRDYLHVRDVATALRSIALSDAVGSINVASGAAFPIRDLIERVAVLANASHLLRLGALPYRIEEPHTIRGDVSRLRRMGWAPSIDIETGLLETIDWWRRAEAA